MIVVGGNMEDLFIQIEEKVADATSLEELKAKKLEYIKQHRLVLLYFNSVQEMIEQENYDEGIPW